MTTEKVTVAHSNAKNNSLASFRANVAIARLFDAPLEACRYYCLEGTVHTTGSAGGFDLEVPNTNRIIINDVRICKYGQIMILAFKHHPNYAAQSADDLIDDI